ncbi:hypothetical protein PN290_06095 [Romboutsia sp. 1001216sp1]|uniref:hypothetical protein n=1 Tax=Romboutsia TaxID=1501226 RepID=UPI00159EC0B0|nr:MULTISPECIES: hypothetical protein [Romboutsia]MDB8793737.1 hypothetical protein [Romboutsia sp. 1001216sp1]MDB8795134.1 hypothetical protein [Romboutsia sp. 1001216sp1]MDB8798944.1 hypothetical protein [Romboutsia sp. 1001216sp1]
MINFITDFLEYVGNIFESADKNQPPGEKKKPYTFIGVGLLILAGIISIIFKND